MILRSRMTCPRSRTLRHRSLGCRVRDIGHVTDTVFSAPTLGAPGADLLLDVRRGLSAGGTCPTVVLTAQGSIW